MLYRQSYLIAGWTLIGTATVLIPYVLPELPAGQRFSYLAGNIFFATLASWVIFRAWRNFPIPFGPTLIWLISLGYMSHGQLFRTGYHLGYFELVIGFALIFPVSRARILALYGTGAAIFTTAFFLSTENYGLQDVKLSLFQRDVLFGILVVNALGLVTHWFIFLAQVKKSEMSRRFVDIGKYSALAFHDVKNMVQVPLIRGALLKRRLEQNDPETLELMAGLETDLARVQEFVREVSRFAISGEESPEEMCCEDLFKSIRTLLGLRGECVEFRGTGAPKLIRRRNFLTRAVLNAVLNAIDAVQSLPAAERKVIVTYDNNQITIQDNGGGFPPDILRCLARGTSISTKDGTGGLGTMIIQDYMTAIGGSARFSNDKSGAVVTLRLPER